MNKKNLVKILSKEVTILTDFIDGFDKEGKVHPVEIDLTLSKVKDIYDELLLLKGDVSDKSLDTEIKKEIDYKNNKIVEEISTVNNKDDYKKAVAADITKEKTNKEDVFEILSEKQEIEEDIVTEVHTGNDLTTESNPVAIKENSTLEKQKIENTEPEEVNKKEEENLHDIVDVVSEIKQPEQKEDKYKATAIESEEQQTNDTKKKQIIADTFVNKKPSINDMMSKAKSNKDLASSLKNGPVKDLTKEIKLNDRIWYINELFNKNAATYENAVNAVNSANNLDEALEYLFSNFNWDQSRKSTISFLELVFRRFA